MSDIIRRLRDADGPRDGGDALAPLCWEAADKLERLMALLRWCEEHEPGIYRRAEIAIFGFEKHQPLDSTGRSHGQQARDEE